MAKELPYFKFEPAEYLTKDISFCSLSAQGLFINICSYYWQRGCVLSKEQLLRRLNYPNELDELISEGVIDLIENDISIKFLNSQLEDVGKTSKTNSVNGSKGGRPKKNPNDSETKATLNPNESETITEIKGIREDKIKEDNKPITYNIEKAIEICLKDLEWINSASKTCDLKEVHFPIALKDFKEHCISGGSNEDRTIKDFKYHFVNWVKIKKTLKAKETVKDRL